MFPIVLPVPSSCNLTLSRFVLADRWKFNGKGTVILADDLFPLSNMKLLKVISGLVNQLKPAAVYWPYFLLLTVTWWWQPRTLLPLQANEITAVKNVFFSLSRFPHLVLDILQTNQWLYVAYKTGRLSKKKKSSAHPCKQKLLQVLSSGLAQAQREVDLLRLDTELPTP